MKTNYEILSEVLKVKIETLKRNPDGTIKLYEAVEVMELLRKEMKAMIIQIMKNKNECKRNSRKA